MVRSDSPGDLRPGRGDVVSIQYLRGLAALGVVAFHVILGPEQGRGVTPPFLVSLCSGGVDVFFVISGFIMWRTTEGGGRGPGGFLRARLTRVVPLYWLAMIAYLAVLLAVDGGTMRFPAPVDAVTSFLFVWHTDGRTGDPMPFYGLGWTLNYEMTFYLVFAAGLLVADLRARLAAVAAVFVVLVALRPVLGDAGAMGLRVTSPLQLEFVAGMAIAYLAARARPPAWVGIVALAGSATFVALVSSGHADGARFVVFGVPAALLVLGAVILERHVARWPVRPLRTLGDASYSIYLSHALVLELLLAAVTVPPTVPARIATLAVTVAAGLACYRWVERPLLGLARRPERRPLVPGRASALGARVS